MSKNKNPHQNISEPAAYINGNARPAARATPEAMAETKAIAKATGQPAPAPAAPTPAAVEQPAKPRLPRKLVVVGELLAGGKKVTRSQMVKALQESSPRMSEANADADFDWVAATIQAFGVGAADGENTIHLFKVIRE